MRIRILLLSLAITLGMLWPQMAVAQGKKLKVVTSFSILEDMTRNIGQDLIELHNIVGPNTDMHAFELRPQDIETLASADVFIVNGLGFEPWAGRLIKSANFKGTVVTASRLSRKLQPIEPEDNKAKTMDEYVNQGKNLPNETDSDEHDHGNVDPHAWHNLNNAKLYVANISDALAKADPKHAEFYATNERSYRKELTDLQSWASREVQKFSESKRWIVTNHDGLQYLARAYRIRYVNVIGSGHGDAPSAQKLAEVIQLIKAKNIRAIFYENVTDNRSLDQIAQETGTKVQGVLYTDALSKNGEKANTFVNLYKHNIDAILASWKPGE
jgi:zinc/manganese transport system substrate-binding protein